MSTNFNKVEMFFESRKQYGIKPGLDRVNMLLKSVNNPQNDIKAVHITGTNGKGSTVAYLNDSLLAQNYNVGIFSSPSLTGLCGHIVINNQEITEEQFSYYLNMLMPYIKELDNQDNHPSEFEIITVIAFLYFRGNVNIALIETGMGARLDTTNCIVPIVSVITMIDIDHTQFLGETIEQITYEKAGIVKENVPVVVGDVSPESKKIIVNETKRLTAPLYFLNNDFLFEQNDSNKFTYIDSEHKLNISLNMDGHHQIHNASVALKVLTLLNRNNYNMNWDSVVKSIAKTLVPGRFEQLLANPSIILDGAHNESSMKALIETVQTKFKDKETHIIFAAFKDKQLKQLSQHIKKNFSSITLTSFDHPRAAKTNEISKFFNERDVMINDDWKTVINDVFIKRNENNYIITGSLHFIFLVRQHILENF